MRRAALRRALPIGAAVAVYGVSYGVLAVTAGLSPTLATLSSLLVLAGGSQFAFVGVLLAGGTPLAGVAGGLLLNLRFVPFGMAIARHLPPDGRSRRWLDSYLVVDEAVAVGLDAPPEEVAYRFRVTGWTVTVAWILATALGAFGGQFLGDPERLGLDAAFPAGFLALLAPWLRTRAGQVAAATGAMIAVALTPVTAPGVPIVAAALGAVVALRWQPSHGTSADGQDPSAEHEEDPWP